MIHESEDGVLSISVSSGHGEDFLSSDFLFRAKTLLEEFADETYEFEFDNKKGRFKIDGSSSSDEIYIQEQKIHLPEYVYLLKCKRTGYFKIGFTKNFQTRFRTLRTSNADIEVVFTERMHNAFENEQHLHAVFAKNRISGEWFSLNGEQVEQVISYIKNKAA